MRKVTAKQLKQWLSESKEIAVLDVREAGQHSAGHPFFSVPVPFSKFEYRVEQLVPNKITQLVVIDDDDGVAERAIQSAAELGYTNLYSLDGGAPAWSTAGYTLFDGVHVPSKVFGEIVEIERNTPRISATELRRRQLSGEKLVVVDGRPFSEYRAMSIPGGQCCPNGELALRIGDIASDEQATIVVNCAGRTRSIIGAQTLIDFGVPNHILALENGTQGWFLAGLELEYGQSFRYPDLDDQKNLATLQERASHLADAAGVKTVSPTTVEHFLGDESRTTYVFDVRTEEEHDHDGLPAVTHAPGGQLIQAMDHWVGVKGSRIVVVDNEMVRAPVVAYWLKQLGQDVYVLENGMDAARSMGSLILADSGKNIHRVATTDAAGLISLGDLQLVDLRNSMKYRAGHLAGARWSTRSRFDPKQFRPHLPVVLISEDVAATALYARDLELSGFDEPVLRLGGHPDEWREAGLEVVVTDNVPADEECIDFAFHTHDRHAGNAAAARAYIAWETGLVERLDRQEKGVFKLAALA